MASKDVIIKFKRTTEPAHREAALQDIVKNGGSIVKSNNINSSILPYAVVKVTEDEFAGLQKNLAGHSVIDNVELDSTVTTQ